MLHVFRFNLKDQVRIWKTIIRIHCLNFVRPFLMKAMIVLNRTVLVLQKIKKPCILKIASVSNSNNLANSSKTARAACRPWSLKLNTEVPAYSLFAHISAPLRDPKWATNLRYIRWPFKGSSPIHCQICPWGIESEMTSYFSSY